MLGGFLSDFGLDDLRETISENVRTYLFGEWDEPLRYAGVNFLVKGFDLADTREAFRSDRNRPVGMHLTDGQLNCIADMITSSSGTGKLFKKTFNDTKAHVCRRLLQKTYENGQIGYHKFFENIRSRGPYIEREFAELFKNPKRTCLPEGVNAVYASWLKDNPMPEVSSEVESSEEAPVVIEAVTADSDVDNITMAEDAIKAGAEGDMLSIAPHDGDAPKQDYVEAPHIDYIVDAVKRHFDLDGKIKVYHAPDRGYDVDLSYKMLEFSEKNGKTHHIATNNWYGMMTCVIKDMKDIDPESPEKIDLLELIHEGKAWSVKCFEKEIENYLGQVVGKSADGYQQRIVELCKADFADLAPQKKKMSWANKMVGAVDALRGYYLANGQVPKANKDDVQHGSLKGKVTYKALYSALNKGSISGLEKVENFHDLLDVVEGKYPGTKGHANKPTIDARDLFSDVVNFVKVQGIPPQAGVVDGLNETLAGYKESELKRYFGQTEKGGLTHLQDVLKPEFSDKSPKDLDEFVIMSGIGVSVDQAIELNPDFIPE